jgi:hypothetical protein
MNLELNNDQKMLLGMVNKFARNQILPQAKKRDEKGEYPLEIMNLIEFSKKFFSFSLEAPECLTPY